MLYMLKGAAALVCAAIAVVRFQSEERTLLLLPLVDGCQECTYRDLARRLPEGPCADG
jgi:hypothetical protein